VQDGGDDVDDEAALATDATVQPTKTAISSENTVFSKMRLCI